MIKISHIRGYKLHRAQSEGPAVVYVDPETADYTHVDEYSYYQNGKRHASGIPAHVSHRGNEITMKWYTRGVCYNPTGPAVVTAADGVITHLEWRDAFGKLHRVDGPAEETFDESDTYTAWHIHGKRHRQDGPAICTRNEMVRSDEYFIHDKRHRADGPAYIEYDEDGSIIDARWYVHGVQVAPEAPIRFMKDNTVCAEYTRDGTGMRYKNSERICFLNPTLSKIDGPALIIDPEGVCESRWYLNGKLHREDGPALTRDDGEAHYYIHGKPHRTGGPAVEYAGGFEWWLNGVYHREDGPAYSNAYNTAWYLHGKCHRPDGPALIKMSSGEISCEKWYLNGKLHRIDGPADIRYRRGPDGTRVISKSFWYIKGRRVSGVAPLTRAPSAAAPATIAS